MKTPNFHDIFMGLEYVYSTSKELEEAELNFGKALDSLENKLSNKEYDLVYEANIREHHEAQYLGFVDGFKLAIYLITGIENVSNLTETCERVTNNSRASKTLSD